MMRVISSVLSLIVMLACAHARGGESIVYDVDGVQYEGYFQASDAGRALVLVVHDWDGLTEYEQKRAAMLAELGYDVFAVDLFGAGVRPTETADKRRLIGALYQDRATMRRLLRAGLEQARIATGAQKPVVAAGYCFGGSAVLELARSGESLKGFASFHGGLALPEGQDYSLTQGKVLVYHGSADQAVSMQEFASLAVDLEAAGVDHEMTTYSGAPHAFSVLGGRRYHEEADRQSWAAFVAQLETLTLSPK